MFIKNSTPIAVAVYPSAPDVESQESAVPKAMEENTTMIIDDDDNAGKGMGIAIFILIIIGFIITIIIGTVSDYSNIPYLDSACFITALVLASVLTCGCCCAKNYNLKPHVRKMATETLATLVVLFIVDIGLSVIATQYGYDEMTGTFNDDIWYYDETIGKSPFDKLLTGAIIWCVLMGLALIFSGIFTWGRKCGAPRV